MNYQTSSMYVPKLSRINKFIIIACAVVFFLNLILSKTSGFSLSSFLALNPALVIQGHVHQLLTYPFVSEGFLGVVFECMIVWFIGSDLEGRWGEKTYVQFLLAAVIGAAILYSIYSLIYFGTSPIFSVKMMGLSGLCYALLIAYGLIFSDRVLSFMMIFPVQARYFVWLIVGIELVMTFSSSTRTTALGHLSAMLCGYLFLRYRSYSSSAKSKVVEFERQKRLDKAKGRLYVVPEEDKKKKDDPKYWQ